MAPIHDTYVRAWHSTSSVTRTDKVCCRSGCKYIRYLGSTPPYCLQTASSCPIRGSPRFHRPFYSLLPRKMPSRSSRAVVTCLQHPSTHKYARFVNAVEPLPRFLLYHVSTTSVTLSTQSPTPRRARAKYLPNSLQTLDPRDCNCSCISVNISTGLGEVSRILGAL